MLDMAPFWSELTGILNDVWPEAASGYRSSDAGSKNWRDEIESGRVEAPFVVIRATTMTPNESDGLPITRHYWDLAIEIYYVRSRSLAPEQVAAAVKLEDLVRVKCLELFEVLHNDPHSTFQMVDEMRIDCGDTNSVNLLCDTRQAPYYSGALLGTLLVWEPE